MSLLVGFRDLLEDARRHDAAVGAFTVYNAETAHAVLRAAARRGCGVMLLVSSQAFRSEFGEPFVAALHGMATRSAARCCLELDHEQELGRIARALACGFGAVMADGSNLPVEENVSFVQAAARLADWHGAHLEAELGHVAGDEEIAAAAARGAFTNPQEASDYVRTTHAACLAVSIGNVHGRYLEPPRLDWERLAEIRSAVTVPLSLHGASGIPDAEVRRAVLGGIAKVNVNTELRDRYFDVLAARAGELRDGARMLALARELSAAVEQVVEAKLELFGW